MLFWMLIYIASKDESMHHFWFSLVFYSALEIGSYLPPRQELTTWQNVLPYVSQGSFLCVELSFPQAWSIP